MNQKSMLVLLLLAAFGVQAGQMGNPPPGQEGGRPPMQGGMMEQGRPHGPPPEALAACKGKRDGDQVSFNDRQGKPIKAVCRLVAMPEQAMGSQPPKP